MDWTDTVLRDYVLPDLRPDVVIDWMGPLDAAQHKHGVGSRRREALRAIDKSLSRTIAAIGADARPASSKRHHVGPWLRAAHQGVNVVDSLVAAGLKKERRPQDVVVASQGQSVLFYVPS